MKMKQLVIGKTSIGKISRIITLIGVLLAGVLKWYAAYSDNDASTKPDTAAVINAGANLIEAVTADDSKNGAQENDATDIDVEIDPGTAEDAQNFIDLGLPACPDRLPDRRHQHTSQ